MTGVGNPTKRKIINKARPQDGIGNPTKRKKSTRQDTGSGNQTGNLYIISQ